MKRWKSYHFATKNSANWRLIGPPHRANASFRDAVRESSPFFDVFDIYFVYSGEKFSDGDQIRVVTK